MIFKNTLRSVALAGIALAGFAQTASALTADNTIMLGFFASGGQGADTNVMVNLGVYQPGYSFTSTNINADLTAVYGANWNTRTDLFWSLAGGSGTDAGTTRTIFLGKDSGSYNALSSTQMVNATNGIYSVYQTIDPTDTTYYGVAGANSLVTRVAANPTGGLDNSWAERAETATETFKLGISNIAKSEFRGDTDFTLITAPHEMQLWTANGTGAWQQASLVGGYSLDSAGNISAVAAVPEPSTYGLMGAGALAAIAAVRRRRNKVA